MSPCAAKPHPSVIATPLRDGETVLLHLDSKRYYSLDAVGGQFWRALKANGTDLLGAPAIAQPFWALLLDEGLILTCEGGDTPPAWPDAPTPPTLTTYPALAGITFLSGGGVAGPVVF